MNTLIQVTGFFPHLTHLLHHLEHLGVIDCTRVHHPRGWLCLLTFNPGGPLRP